jgi:hypothetical protein
MFINRLERNARESPLLRLPAELRNRIYDLVLYEGDYNFASHFYIKDDQDQDDFLNFEGFKVDPKVPNRLGLIRTCRQLYAETVLLPFSLNTFVFRTHAMQYFFDSKTTMAQSRAIRAIELHLAISDGSIFLAHPKYTPMGATRESQVDRYTVSFCTALPGLASIYVRVSKYDGHTWNEYPPGYDREKARNANRQCLMEWLHEGNKTDVKIVVEDVDWARLGNEWSL